MIVVSDTGPILYLSRLNLIGLLPELYRHVIVPASVARELSDERAPEAVRQWIAHPPVWVAILEGPAGWQEAVGIEDMGEAEAIAIALANRPARLLTDDREARNYAAAAGLEVTGTVGILLDSGFRGLIDFEPSLSRLLTETNFRASPGLVELAREIYRRGSRGR